MEIKDLFLKDADYAKAFEAAQSGFEEAKKEVEQRFVDTVRDKLHAKGYAVEGEIDAYTYEWQWFYLDLFHFKDDHFQLWIERRPKSSGKALCYGFGFSSEEELSHFQEIVKAELGTGKEQSYLWLKWFGAYDNTIIEFFDKNALDTFAEKWVKEITSSVETLKQAEEFKEYLV